MYALITGDNVELNIRADHGLHELVKGWLLDFTAPVFENECCLNIISPLMDFQSIIIIIALLSRY